MLWRGLIATSAAPHARPADAAMASLQYLVDAATSIAPSITAASGALPPSTAGVAPPALLFGPMLGLSDLMGNSLFSSSMAPLWKFPASMPPPPALSLPVVAGIQSEDSGTSAGKRLAEEVGALACVQMA